MLRAKRKPIIISITHFRDYIRTLVLKHLRTNNHFKNGK